MIDATNVILKFATVEELPSYILKCNRLNCIKIIDFVSDLQIELTPKPAKPHPSVSKSVTKRSRKHKKK